MKESQARIQTFNRWVFTSKNLEMKKKNPLFILREEIKCEIMNHRVHNVIYITNKIFIKDYLSLETIFYHYRLYYTIDQTH